MTCHTIKWLAIHDQCAQQVLLFLSWSDNSILWFGSLGNHGYSIILDKCHSTIKMKPEKHREIIAMKQVRILFYIFLNFLLRYKLVELFTHLQQINWLKMIRSGLYFLLIKQWPNLCTIFTDLFPLCFWVVQRILT